MATQTIITNVNADEIGYTFLAIASGSTTAQNLNDITITGGGAGAVIFQTAVTNPVIFRNFTVNTPKTVTFTSSRAFGVTGTFSAIGTAINAITINASTTSVAYLLTSGAILNTDYSTFTYISLPATITTAYSLGPHSTVGTGTVGFGLISYQANDATANGLTT